MKAVLIRLYQAIMLIPIMTICTVVMFVTATFAIILCVPYWILTGKSAYTALYDRPFDKVLDMGKWLLLEKT